MDLDVLMIMTNAKIYNNKRQNLKIYQRKSTLFYNLKLFIHIIL